jgi:mannan endo-1,4-beta-mannosidase
MKVPHRARLILAVLVTVAATLCPSLIVERTMLVGVYQPNSPGSYGQVSNFAQEAGFNPRILSYYTTSFSQPFPLQFAESAGRNGAMVLVQWQPRGTTSQAIASGQQDAAIRSFAQQVAQDPYQVIISYGQEMNGNWYSWGAGGTDGSSGPAYIAAWRHIWTIFQQAGVHNVTWLWDPNIIYNGSAPLAQWYPGDQYVDWVGLDGYFAYPWLTFDTLFGPSIQEIRTFTAKPLLIAESGVSGTAGPGQIASLFAGAELAGAVGIVYFDEAQSGDPEHQDWRLEDDASNMSAFRAAVQQYAQRPLILSVTAG